MTANESCCTCATILTPPSWNRQPSSDSLLFSKLASDTARSSTHRTDKQDTEDLPPSYATPDSSIASLRSLTVDQEAIQARSQELEPEKKQEKQNRRLPCCNRLICARCLIRNPRFESYCPFCQVSSKPTALPQGGLRDPPGYESSVLNSNASQQRRHQVSAMESCSSKARRDDPPSYTDALNPISSSSSKTPSQQQEEEGEEEREEDTIHFLHPSDSITSLSLSYHVPVQVLRTHNQLFSDSLLAARRTLLIPSSHYKGPSLSDKPIESEEESARKANIRAFMMRTKCHDYEIAELYLKNTQGGDDSADQDVDRAVEAWEGDEKWERENPLKGKRGLKGLKGGPAKGRGNVRGGLGGGFTGQLS